ncbi:MAG: HAD family phosphatase, partial [Solirubrobacterales bacterium]
MALRCVYVDLDGTLLGWGASLFHDGEGELTTDGVRAVEACLRANVEICIYSGRRQAQVMEDARLFGQNAYIFEVGSGLV